MLGVAFGISSNRDSVQPRARTWKARVSRRGPSASHRRETERSLGVRLARCSEGRARPRLRARGPYPLYAPLGPRMPRVVRERPTCASFVRMGSFSIQARATPASVHALGGVGASGVDERWAHSGPAAFTVRAAGRFRGPILVKSVECRPQERTAALVVEEDCSISLLESYDGEVYLQSAHIETKRRAIRASCGATRS